MIIVRTCGSGTDYNDERLQLLKKMIEFPEHEELNKKIFKLHDHKGDLSVYWYENPTESQKEHVKHAWEYLRECNVEHYVITITEKQI